MNSFYKYLAILFLLVILPSFGTAAQEDAGDSAAPEAPAPDNEARGAVGLGETAAPAGEGADESAAPEAAAPNNEARGAAELGETAAPANEAWENNELGGTAAPAGAEISPVKRWFNRATLSFGGSILLFQEDYGFDAAPVPILPAPSLAFTLPPLGNNFAGGALELTLDMYFTHYKYSYELNRPVPAEIENRSAFVFGPILAFQLQGYLRINMFRIRLNAGISGDLRIVLLAEDLNEADLEDANKQKDDIAAFFSQYSQWLFPVAGLGMDFQITPHWAGGLDFRIWAPLDFSGTGEQFLGWRFGVGFRMFKKAGFFETPAKAATR
ncbi:MAG: hypothetical protein LBJ35_04610 [Spirochaetaceae bacterium]|nr:hypothetical protein [Spirochaetaceae bacterium]